MGSDVRARLLVIPTSSCVSPPKVSHDLLDSVTGVSLGSEEAFTRAQMQPIAPDELR
jgi:hypothetical protein